MSVSQWGFDYQLFKNYFIAIFLYFFVTILIMKAITASKEIDKKTTWYFLLILIISSGVSAAEYWSSWYSVDSKKIYLVDIQNLRKYILTSTVTVSLIVGTIYFYNYVYPSVVNPPYYKPMFILFLVSLLAISMLSVTTTSCAQPQSR